MSGFEKYVKAVVGPNPKEAGIPPEVQKAQLQSRLRRGQIIMAAFGILGLAIIAITTGVFNS
ncbi:MAG: hypothetical protein AAFR23_00585 [Pseudomonadota bacterium]